jgi:biotin carboxyl carrier protein
MQKAKVNQHRIFNVQKESGNDWKLNDSPVQLEVSQAHPNILTATFNGRRYEALLLKYDEERKTVTLKINGNKYAVELKDQYDELLEKLGMDSSSEKKVNKVKAPMPGLVLDICVAEGAEVKKGDALLVLEAMKMENILKSPGDGTVMKILVKKGTAVEKNQVLIEF